MLERCRISKLKVYMQKAVNVLIYYSGLYHVLDALLYVPGIYMLYYHRLVNKKTEKVTSKISVEYNGFERQIEYFRKKYKMISIDQARDILASGKPADGSYLVLTFDDGYQDNYLYGRSIFEKYSLKPVIYVTAGHVDKQIPLWPDRIRRMVYASSIRKVHIDVEGMHCKCSITTLYGKVKLVERLIKQLKSCNEEKKHAILMHLSKVFDVKPDSGPGLMLTWEEICELKRIGVDIGSHTQSHPILSCLEKEDIWNELYDSKILIEKRAGIQVDHFAYPNGRKCDYNPYARDVAACYYKSAATTVEGINRPGENLFELKRIGILYDMSLVDIKVKILYLKVRHILQNVLAGRGTSPEK